MAPKRASPAPTAADPPRTDIRSTAAPRADSPRDTAGTDPEAAGRWDDDGTWVVTLGGRWALEDPSPPSERLLPPDWQRAKALRFATRDLGTWGSPLIVLVLKLVETAEDRGVPVDLAGLPPGAQGLLRLARAVPEREEGVGEGAPSGLFARVGKGTLAALDRSVSVVAFVGELTVALVRLAAGRGRMRFADFLVLVQQAGAQALGIVGLISVLVGLILAFVGSLELAYFGAQVYIADAVALGMVREMGALMTAVIMAGRTGAAYAAQLGSMHANEEIDALRTMGLDPVEFLVLPRVLALLFMLPLLTLYANALGIVGGMAVAVGLFDITLPQYITQTRGAVTLADLGVGLVMSAIFAVIVALAGCWQGLHSGRTAAAVGDATTNAVVGAIVGIVVANSLVTLVTTRLGI